MSIGFVSLGLVVLPPEVDIIDGGEISAELEVDSEIICEVDNN